MAKFSAATLAAPMIASGNVTPLREFLTTEQRAALPEGAEAPRLVNEFGMPLLGVEVLVTESAFGEQKTVPYQVRVPESKALHGIAPFSQVEFEGLEADVYVSQPKGGGRAQLRVSYSASGVRAIGGKPVSGGDAS